MVPADQVVQPDDVLQIHPDYHHKAFAACFMVVTEVKPWGCIGFVQGLGPNRNEMGGRAFLRPEWKDIEWVGHAPWTVFEPEEIPDDSR